MPTRKQKNGTGLVVNTPDGHRYREYTTTRGVVVRVTASPPLGQAALDSALRQDWESQGKALPVKPTFEIKAAAGNIEVHEHDATTVKGDPVAEAAWQAWQKAKAEFEEEIREQSIRSMVLDCVEFDIDPAWAAKAKAKRVKVPTDEFERKLYYAYTTVFGAAEDYSEVMIISAEMAGATEQQIVAVREAFLYPLEKPGRAKARTAPAKEGQVVAE